MTFAAQRAAVVAEALSWLGTPYHHQGRIKGVGIDCAQLAYGVYHACGLIPSMPLDDYPPDWHLHRDAERYLGRVLEYAHEVETGLPGDLVLYQVGRAFAHGAIIVEWPSVVHAVAAARHVLLDCGEGGQLAGRKRRFFSLWGGAHG